VAAVGTEVVMASRARPFTWPADIVTSAALVAMVGIVVVQHFGSATTPCVARRSGPPVAATARHRGWRWAIWATPLAAIVAWELTTYFGTPRAEHPTLSSMLDVVTATPWGRGVAFASWLVLGWFVVTR
jgi:hypothetical protein